LRLLFTLCFILILAGEVFATLPEDSKFVARILGASDSKRTILVNRGRENGLTPDLHAKVSIPSGVIARAVIVKLSPSRSVWSVYRIFSKDQITAQTVATFKVSSPVKLTTDESRALGILAEKVDKKREKIPEDPTFDKKQKTIGRQILRSQRITSQFDNIDYTNLEQDDQIISNPTLDPDLDWGALNGKKDGEGFERGLDYSRLR
jgi:hypothetical protein